MDKDNSGKVIMIHSYKGGTGKTVIALNLAQFLSRKLEKKILLIEQDTRGSSFSDIFNIESKVTWNDFYNKGLQFRDLVKNLKYYDIICANMEEIKIPTNQSPKIFFVRQLERLNKQKKWLINNYDYVILDTSPGYSFELINSISIADIAALTTRLDIDTIPKTIEMYNQIYSHFKDRKMILIQNQVPTPVDSTIIEETNANVNKIMKKWEKFISDKKIVTIPLNNEIAYSLSKNKIINLKNPLMEYIEVISNHLINF